MEEKNSPYSTRESFISELAVAMSVYNICEDQYLNLTQQNLLFVQRENTVWDENGLQRVMKSFLWIGYLRGRHLIRWWSLLTA